MLMLKSSWNALLYACGISPLSFVFFLYGGDLAIIHSAYAWVLMLVLWRPRYRYAGIYTYAYVVVKTRLKVCETSSFQYDDNHLQLGLCT